MQKLAMGVQVFAREMLGRPLELKASASRAQCQLVCAQLGPAQLSEGRRDWRACSDGHLQASKADQLGHCLERLIFLARVKCCCGRPLVGFGGQKLHKLRARRPSLLIGATWQHSGAARLACSQRGRWKPLCSADQVQLVLGRPAARSLAPHHSGCSEGHLEGHSSSAS